MKKLVYLLAIVFITASSFTTKESLASHNEEFQWTCYDSCDQYANAIASTFGLPYEQEFAAFEQCYGSQCNDDGDGVFTFP